MLLREVVSINGNQLMLELGVLLYIFFSYVCIIKFMHISYYKKDLCSGY